MNRQKLRIMVLFCLFIFGAIQLYPRITVPKVTANADPFQQQKSLNKQPAFVNDSNVD